jgi:hypothetical protein
MKSDAVCLIDFSHRDKKVELCGEMTPCYFAVSYLVCSGFIFIFKVAQEVY